MDVYETYVDVDGGELWSAAYGDGGKRPVVLVPGGPGCPSYYLEDLARSLSNDRTVVVYDPRGAGRSFKEPRADSMTLEQFGRDLEAVIQVNKLRRPVVFGHSFGGLLAVHLATNRPELLSGLVLASPLISANVWSADAELLIDELDDDVAAALRVGPDSPAYASAEDVFYNHFFCRLDPWPESLTRTMNETATDVYEEMWGPNEFTQTGLLGGVDVSDDLRNISLPVHWTCGEHDEARPETLLKFAGSADKLTMIPDASHCAHMEKPDEMVAALETFLSGIDSEEELSHEG